MKFIRTWKRKDEGGGQRTHLDGSGASYTLCGLDTAGDTAVHAQPPQELEGFNHRITCEDCKQVIEYVREYLARNE